MMNYKEIMISKKFEIVRELLPVKIEIDNKKRLYFSQSYDVDNAIYESCDSYSIIQLLKILFRNPQLGIQYTIHEMSNLLIYGGERFEYQYPEETEMIWKFINMTKENIAEFYDRGSYEYYVITGDIDKTKFKTFEDIIDHINKIKVKYPVNIVKKMKRPGMGEARYCNHITIGYNNGIWAASDKTESDSSNIIDWLNMRFSEIGCYIPNPFVCDDMVIDKSTGAIGFVVKESDSKELARVEDELLVKVNILNNDCLHDMLIESYFPLIFTEEYKISKYKDQLDMLRYFYFRDNGGTK